MLDLSQLYQKPAAQLLLSTLADLSLQPLSWDGLPSPKRRKIRSEGIPSYLTKIVSSPLAWIDDDNKKEQIWEVASQRLSERSGRTAMGAIERTFNIPLAAVKSADPCGNTPLAAIKLHEPALTGDNLGLKTWASSFLLAKRLATLKEEILPALTADQHILELGSGTGLVGLAAAVVFNRAVILTDLPEIVPNLEHNISCNAALLSETDANAQSAVLDWSNPSSLSLLSPGSDVGALGQPFPLILAADPIYSPSHPALFVQAVDAQLSRQANARVVIELPLREAYVPERQDLVGRMEQIGLRRVMEGEEVGYDDWSAGGDGEELDEVRCWWSVWAWEKED